MNQLTSAPSISSIRFADDQSRGVHPSHPRRRGLAYPAPRWRHLLRLMRRGELDNYGRYKEWHASYVGSGREPFTNQYFTAHDDADIPAPTTPIPGSPPTPLRQPLMNVSYRCGATYTVSSLFSYSATEYVFKSKTSLPSVQLKHILRSQP